MNKKELKESLQIIEEFEEKSFLYFIIFAAVFLIISESYFMSMVISLFWAIVYWYLRYKSNKIESLLEKKK